MKIFMFYTTTLSITVQRQGTLKLFQHNLVLGLILELKIVRKREEILKMNFNEFLAIQIWLLNIGI